MKKHHCTAIVLAAGKGRRMGTDVEKQYLEVAGKPVLYYSLKVFQDSSVIDDILLIVGKEQEEYCRSQIVRKYGITKVRQILPGGAERYHSVWNGLQEIDENGFVFIHDGARPFVDEEMIARAYDTVTEHNACVVGMPIKDTIKMADDNEFVTGTPDRRCVWQIQTPQVFAAHLVKGAYSMLMRESYISVTDDAMVVEQMLGYPIKLVRGSYENIKITTPEDLEIAKIFVERKKREKPY